MNAQGRMFEAVLEAAVDPIIVIDGAGVMLNANPATTDLFGYSNAELLGRNVSMLMPEPYRSEHDSYLERYLATGERHIIGIGREVAAERADGSVFPIALAVSQVDLPGEPPRFTGIIHDITDRVDAAARLLDANERLEQRVQQRTDELRLSLAELSRSNRDLEQFAYIASHDLRAPLRNVKQGVGLLEHHLQTTLGEGFDDEANELRQLIDQALGRMTDLINGLLEYSRVNQTGELETETVDLTEIANGVVEALVHEIKDAGATVEVEDLPVVDGNRIQLRQLLSNLIQNALRYRKPSTPSRIELSAAKGDDNWVISVQDNGIGVAADQHERIFDLFRRGHDGYGGVGIGLAICQRIVERHDGEIWIESEPDEGSVFRFSLPHANLRADA